MFTEKFIKLPIRVYDGEKEEMELKDVDEMEVTIRIMPDQIESYYRQWKDDTDVVQVMTKSGDGFCVYMKIKEFEKILNEDTNG